MKNRLEKKKGQLLEALCKKGLTMIDIVEKQAEENRNPSSNASSTEEDTKSFENVTIDTQDSEKKRSDFPSKSDINKVYFQVSKLCKGDVISEASNEKLVAKFVERHAIFVSDFGRAVKVILKQLESTPSESIEQRLRDVLEKNSDWSHIRDFLQRTRHSRYPHAYRIF
jgi:hypothetical protein